MQIFKGRPVDESNRLKKEIRVYDFLDKLGIEYERVDHEPADSMEACIDIEKIIGVGIFKNLFLCNRQKTKYYLLMMDGRKNFRTADVSKQIGSSRLSFATSEDMEKYLDVTPGSVSVLALMNDKNKEIKLLIDEELILNENIRCHPCKNTSTLKISTKDFLNIILPTLGYEPIYVKLNTNILES